MLIIYHCTKCEGKRYFSNVQTKTVQCKNCNSEMQRSSDNITADVMTSEEARFLGDEALYNTVGNRINDKHSKHFTGK